MPNKNEVSTGLLDNESGLTNNSNPQEYSIYHTINIAHTIPLVFLPSLNAPICESIQSNIAKFPKYFEVIL